MYQVFYYAFSELLLSPTNHASNLFMFIREQAQEKLDEVSGETSSSLDIDREERLVTGLTDILGQNKVRGRIKAF